MKMIDLGQFQGFDWDHGNQHKNWIKHGVTQSECEQIFFNEPLAFNDDLKHSDLEPRYYAFGQTDKGRKLCIIFTIRGALIRVISARDMDRREREYYEKIETDTYL